MNRVMLFERKDENIKITIEAFFNEEGNLVIDGYDIGKITEEFWGDSDYEYSLTVAKHEVLKLYPILELPVDDKSALLTALQSKFNTNSCYSEIQTFLDKHGIVYESFSWT